MKPLQNRSVKSGISLLIATSFLCTSVSNVSNASPAKAQDTAETLGLRLAAKNYGMDSASTPDLLKEKDTVVFQIQVSPWSDYAIVVAGDEEAKDIDLYIYDEGGQKIISDDRPNAIYTGGEQPSAYACATFKATYQGTVKLVISMKKTGQSGLAGYCVIQCSKRSLKQLNPGN